MTVKIRYLYNVATLYIIIDNKKFINDNQFALADQFTFDAQKVAVVVYLL